MLVFDDYRRQRSIQRKDVGFHKGWHTRILFPRHASEARMHGG